MASPPLDAIDRGVLYQLQLDATQPITAIADELNVADNTVRNRIQKLEGRGVIDGYTVDVNYDRAGVQHYYLFVCTARVAEREPLAAAARETSGVVEVMTLMTGTMNVYVTAAAPDKESITEIAYRLDEGGLVIEREYLIWKRDSSPYAGFRPNERP